MHAAAVLGFTLLFLVVAAWGSVATRDAPTDETRAAVNQPVTRYALPVLVYLGALVFQPAFDPDTTAADWVATGVMVAAFCPCTGAWLSGISDA